MISSETYKAYNMEELIKICKKMHKKGMWLINAKIKHYLSHIEDVTPNIMQSYEYILTFEKENIDGKETEIETDYINGYLFDEEEAQNIINTKGISKCILDNPICIKVDLCDNGPIEEFVRNYFKNTGSKSIVIKLDKTNKGD